MGFLMFLDYLQHKVTDINPIWPRSQIKSKFTIIKDSMNRFYLFLKP